jgi:hypothetical protein
MCTSFEETRVKVAIHALLTRGEDVINVMRWSTESDEDQAAESMFSMISTGRQGISGIVMG